MFDRVPEYQADTPWGSGKHLSYQEDKALDVFKALKDLDDEVELAIEGVEKYLNDQTCEDELRKLSLSKVFYVTEPTGLFNLSFTVDDGRIKMLRSEERLDKLRIGVLAARERGLRERKF